MFFVEFLCMASTFVLFLADNQLILYG